MKKLRTLVLALMALVSACAMAASYDDNYKIGNENFSTGWWQAFSHDYAIANGGKWTETFDLHINPNAQNTYKNFALIITNDEDRGTPNYQEYGAIRFDHQPTGNSEWGEYINRSCATSNLTFQSDTDPGVQKLGGRVTLTVDRTVLNSLEITMTNGEVTKTYKHPDALPNLNSDKTNEKIRCFLVVEGSWIEFVTCDIYSPNEEDLADADPYAFVYDKYPKQMYLGTSLEEAFRDAQATILFRNGAKRKVFASDLVITPLSDMNVAGTKTIRTSYNYTYKYQRAETPAYVDIEIEVKEKPVYNPEQCIGNTDYSTPFWGAHSEPVRVAPGETCVTEFINHSCGESFWNNWHVVLNNSDLSVEYAVLRADNFGWGSAYDGHCINSCNWNDWSTWFAAMDGAKVTMYVTNNGNGTADVKAVSKGIDDVEYVVTYTGLLIDSNDFSFHFTVERSFLEFANTVGKEDNTSEFFSALSSNYNVPAKNSVTLQFINYTSGENNWNNWGLVLNASDVSKEYAAVRADNFGWSGVAMPGSYDACTHSCSWNDWGKWLAAMNGAEVTLTVTNNGNGTADIKAVAIGNDGVEYIQTYNGLKVNSDDLNFRIFVDHSHYVINSTSRPESSIPTSIIANKAAAQTTKIYTIDGTQVKTISNDANPFSDLRNGTYIVTNGAESYKIQINK